MNCFFFHKWGKWEQFDIDVPERLLTKNWMLSGSTKHMQNRVCEKCGKQQQEKIGETIK